MAAPLDVCIRGDGVVGRTLALLLARDRHRVGLVQSPDAPSADIRAYAMNAASRELLGSLRAWPDEAHATPVLRMDVHGDNGGLVHFRAEQQHAEALAWIAGAAALTERLGEALRFQPFVELLSEPRPAALTVVCEGKDSRTRADFGVEYEVRHYAQHAIAARLRCEKPHDQVARQWFMDGDILALLPLAGPLGHEVALVWSVGQERASELMALDAPTFEQRLAEGCRGSLGAMTLTTERTRWPLQLSKASRWCGPGWVLAGDAAHTVHPLAGQGLNLGLADAHELARVLHAREYWRPLGDEKLLRRYERARKAQVMAMQWATDGLQQLFAQDARPVGWLRNWGMRGFEHSGPLKTWVARQAAGRL
ncbi:FAD-dependent monooxygenase [Ramlibacter rhizophilus]|uniref:Ubiquinone biosynthesis protein UbiH n=1 Tax=Ramlibacter rhizophilus TaxID=1781167 RepID=A0A4Z0BGC2_9BURK|nr:FAD-dependent monooxygenase [Ramlibacter rhizophilus]TFY97503.1 ubiquinone biosynthesis protein UbiH [Ramlibacter rhizophilus]